MKKVVLSLSILVISLTNSFAQQNEVGGPPKLNEIIGFWKKVEIPNEENLNKMNPWPQKFQWYAFYENGKVYSMMSNNDTNYSAKDLEEIFKVLPSEKTPNYKLEGQFITIDNKEIESYLELWGVNIFYIDLNETFKKGDLIMTLDNGNGEVVCYRLLRKIE